MYRRTAIAALLLPVVLHPAPPQLPPDAPPEPVILKSTSRAVQLDVFVDDPSGHPVHGLQKNDFFVTDNGRRRDIRIFAGEIDADRSAPPSSTPPGVYSNRFGMRDSRIVTALVLDAVPRTEDFLNTPRMFGATTPEFSAHMVRGQAVSAIHRMIPGQVMAIYAACPELRVIQDYTSDPDRLVASLNAFVPPPLPRGAGRNTPQLIEPLIPPMLAALRDVAGRMSAASGRKSVVWLSQAFGPELNVRAIAAATDATIAAFNDANVPLYAVDTRFNPTCEPAVTLPGDQRTIVTSTCDQPSDISDRWMDRLAQATGGRAFLGKVTGNHYWDPQEKRGWGQTRLDSDHGIVSDALSFAADESRYAYEIGFYVPESELDGKLHSLRVTVPGKPKFGLRHRTGYTASAGAATPPTAQELTGPDSQPKPASPLNPDQVGIDGKIDSPAKAKNDLQVSLALAPETVTRAADGAIVLDATFTQTDASGKQLTKLDDTVRIPSPETPTGMVPYTRAVKLANGAILLHITIRDRATKRIGSIAIPIEK